jgi:hypothetical protein
MRAAHIAAIAFMLLTIGSSLLSAHHSFAAEFDASAPIALEGTVSRLEWTNPHAWIYVDVTDAEGNVVTWAIEASAPSALARHGVRPDRLVPGVRITVRGYRAKNGTTTARGRNLTLPDGRTVSLGGSGENGAWANQ